MVSAFPSEFAFRSVTGAICAELAKIYTDTYVVQPGDTLLRLSMKYKVRKQELANVNNIFGDSLFQN